MEKLFDRLCTELAAGRPLVMATVVSGSGSVPGGAGARMLVGAGGRLCGTVGGGTVEHAAEAQAREVLATKRPLCRSYVLRPNEAEDLGMICGGEVGICFQHLAPTAGTLAFARQVAACFKRDENAWLVVDFGSGSAAAAWRMGLRAASPGLLWAPAEEGGEGTPTLSEAALAPLCGARAAQGTAAGRQVFCDPIVFAGRVVVFGAGHLAAELVPLLARLDFRSLVFDDREDFAGSAAFGTAERVIVGDFASIGRDVALTPQDYVVVVTRGHAADLEVLKQVLRQPRAYVGVVGSRRKMAAVNAQLAAAGISQQAIASLHTPIGLDIGAKTPAEIAVAIAAELILVRAGQRG